MTFILPILMSAAAALGGGGAATVAPPPRAETSIPFVRSQGVLDWRAESERSLFVRGQNGRWYRATTLGTCGRLLSADTIGFETQAGDRLDRFGALRVGGWRCPLASVTRSETPPRHSARRARR